MIGLILVEKNFIMEKFIDRGSPRTPAINFDLANGLLEIRGRSLPENSFEFYKPLSDAIDKYSLSVKTNTTVNIYFDYFNTNSSKSIFDIFKKLEKIHKRGNPIIINWNYEDGDDDMLENGEDYKNMISIPFKMIPVVK